MNVDTVLAALVSHAAASGWFERVNTAEPTNAPGNGLTASIWADRGGPAAGASGLSSTTALMVFTLRIYSRMFATPRDDIDPEALKAVDALLAAYSGDFSLGGSVKQVDVLGRHGTSLGFQAGYLNVSGDMYRIIDVTIPLVVNDAWTQVE